MGTSLFAQESNGSSDEGSALLTLPRKLDKMFSNQVYVGIVANLSALTFFQSTYISAIPNSTKINRFDGGIRP